MYVWHLPGWKWLNLLFYPENRTIILENIHNSYVDSEHDNKLISVDLPEIGYKKIVHFGNVYRMGPTISKSYLTSEKTSGVGTTRIVISPWWELPLMSAEFSLTDEGENTRMRASMNYEIGMGVVGKMMNSVMVKPMNTKNWDSFVAGIRHHIETGEEVSKETVTIMSDIRVIA